MFDFGGGSCANLLLNGALKSCRFAHAYLFCGERFIGKRELARKFAMAVFCEKGRAGPCFGAGPCFECDFCRKFLNGSLVDFYEFSSEALLKGGSVSVEQVRELVSEAFVKPIEGLYKIFLISRVDELLPAAANAILKLLEEPPKHAIFLLTASSRFSVLPTIASRCVWVNVFSDGVDVCFKFLKEHHSSFEESKLMQAAKFSGGSFKQAKLILTDENWKAALEVAKGLLHAYIHENELKFLQFASKMEKSPDSASIVLNLFGVGLNLFLIKTIETKKQVSLFFLEEIQRVMECVDDVKFLILRNVNFKLAITEFCCNVFPK